MDYEKAYKAVLQTATQWIKDGCTDKEKICLECVFPELRESEDERIRQYLIEWVSISDNPRKKECLSWLEKQKEQKPAEKQDYSGLNDLERAIHRGFLVAGVKNVPVGIIKETVRDCLAHLPAKWSDYKDKIDIPYCSSEQEWSEEDADILNCCISSIEEAKENRYAYKETDGDTSYDHEIAWLKSLRPSWKPSDQDELMKLKYAGTSTKLD